MPEPTKKPMVRGWMLQKYPDSRIATWMKKAAEPLQYSAAKKIFRDMAREIVAPALESRGLKYERPSDFVKLDEQSAINFLCDFIVRARNEGLKDICIRDAIRKNRYEPKLDAWIDVSGGQAAGNFGFCVTTKSLDAFDICEGGRPVVDMGLDAGGNAKNILLNGYFAIKRVMKDGEFVNIISELADIKYLPNVCAAAELPQPYMLTFIAKARTDKEIGEMRELLVYYRGEVEKHLPGVQEGHYWNAEDETHRGTVKFRLTCLVWDMRGKLIVVGDGQHGATEFKEWAKRDINSLLSAGDGRLAGLAKDVEALNLIERMNKPPRKSDLEGGAMVHPWKDTMEYAAAKYDSILAAGEKLGAGRNTEKKNWVYKEAIDIWRLALLHHHMQNVEKYEQSWEKKKQLAEVMSSGCKLGCNDGRHAADAKALGAIKTKAGFLKLISHRKKSKHGSTDELEVAFHYGCGFLSGAHNLHLFFERLQTEIYAAALERGYKKENVGLKGFDDYEYPMSQICNLIWGRGVDGNNGIMEMPNAGPVTFDYYIMKYLPEKLRDEYILMLDGKGAGSKKDREFVKMVHDVFVSQNSTMRAIIRRGHETGVLQENEHGFLSMPAAERVYKALDNSFRNEPGGHPLEYGQITNFVIDEVAREWRELYTQWNNELPKRKQIPNLDFYIDNFQDGRAAEIPDAPTSKEDFQNQIRKDHVYAKLEERGELEAFEPKYGLYFKLAP